MGEPVSIEDQLPCDLVKGLKKLLIEVDLLSLKKSADVDGLIELLLDRPDLIKDMKPLKPIQCLADVLGLTRQSLQQLYGGDMAPEVAEVRFLAIQAALLQVIYQAQQVVVGNESCFFLRSIAICACLQFEALGAVEDSQSAFAVEHWGREEAKALAEFLLEKQGKEPTTLCAFLRTYVHGKQTGIFHFQLEASNFQDVEAIHICPAMALSDQANVYAVVSQVEAMTDALAVLFSDNLGLSEQVSDRAFFQATDRSFSASGQTVANAEHLAAAVIHSVGKPSSTLPAFAVYRQGLYQNLYKQGGPDVARKALVTNDLPLVQRMQIWRELSTVPALRVIAPILCSNDHMQTRVGPCDEVDRQVLSRIKALHMMPKLQDALCSDLMAAIAIVCVFSHFADKGLITGRLPDSGKALTFAMKQGRLTDTISYGDFSVNVSRSSRVGLIMMASADLAMLLAYQDPKDGQEKVASDAPLGWLSLAFEDDRRFDIALSVVLSVADALDTQSLRILSEVANCLRHPCSRQTFDKLSQLLGSCDDVSAAPFLYWDTLLEETWQQTSGLSSQMPERVNIFGQEDGQPSGGYYAPENIWSSDETFPNREAQKLQKLNISCEFPSKTVAGYTMSDSAYWPFAKHRGQIFHQELNAVLSPSHAVSSVFEDTGDKETQKLVLTYLTMQADERARISCVLSQGQERGCLSSL